MVPDGDAGAGLQTMPLKYLEAVQAQVSEARGSSGQNKGSTRPPKTMPKVAPDQSKDGSRSSSVPLRSRPVLEGPEADDREKRLESLMNYLALRRGSRLRSLPKDILPGMGGSGGRKRQISAVEAAAANAEAQLLLKGAIEFKRPDVACELYTELRARCVEISDETLELIREAASTRSVDAVWQGRLHDEWPELRTSWSMGGPPAGATSSMDGGGGTARKYPYENYLLARMRPRASSGERVRRDVSPNSDASWNSNYSGQVWPPPGSVVVDVHQGKGSGPLGYAGKGGPSGGKGPPRAYDMHERASSSERAQYAEAWRQGRDAAAASLRNVSRGSSPGPGGGMGSAALRVPSPGSARGSALRIPSPGPWAQPSPGAGAFPGDATPNREPSPAPSNTMIMCYRPPMYDMHDRAGGDAATFTANPARYPVPRSRDPSPGGRDWGGGKGSSMCVFGSPFHMKGGGGPEYEEQAPESDGEGGIVLWCSRSYVSRSYVKRKKELQLEKRTQRQRSREREGFTTFKDSWPEIKKDGPKKMKRDYSLDNKDKKTDYKLNPGKSHLAKPSKVTLSDWIQKGAGKGFFGTKSKSQDSETADHGQGDGNLLWSRSEFQNNFQ